MIKVQELALLESRLGFWPLRPGFSAWRWVAQNVFVFSLRGTAGPEVNELLRGIPDHEAITWREPEGTET